VKGECKRWLLLAAETTGSNERGVIRTGKAGMKGRLTPKDWQESLGRRGSDAKAARRTAIESPPPKVTGWRPGEGREAAAWNESLNTAFSFLFA